MDIVWVFGPICFFYEICGSVVCVRKEKDDSGSSYFLVLKPSWYSDDLDLFNLPSRCSVYRGVITEFSVVFKKFTNLLYE